MSKRQPFPSSLDPFSDLYVAVTNALEGQPKKVHGPVLREFNKARNRANNKYNRAVREYNELFSLASVLQQALTLARATKAGA